MNKTLLLLSLVLCISARAQTNPPELANEILNLEAQLNAVKAQMAVSNPPAVISTVTFSNGVPFATNADLVASTNAAVTAVSDQVKPLVKALEGKYSWFASLVSWATLLAGALAPFRTLIRHGVANYFNSISANATVEQDAYLKELYGSKCYVVLSLIVSPFITLPSNTDLSRAITLQAEAVSKVLPPAVPAGQVATAAQIAAAPSKA
jgi:hypothetical protein